ncbi:MAG: toll/interleukin-1 receptor domain-containing protein [Sphingobacteriales bacterium]|nr:toll/interleukin-1 receptor domain-containing protein [Sphingobacteriales bacterium]
MNVFLAYAPEDELLKNELEEHLSLLQKQGAITVWNAGKIAPGEDISVRTAEQIRAARLILLLISSDFLASDLTEHPDIKNALAQQRINKQVCVIPIVIRDCVWRVGELAHLKPPA